MRDTVDPLELTDEQKAAAKRLAKQGDSPAGLYARMALAAEKQRGIRLDYDDILTLLVGDDAVFTALQTAILQELRQEAW